MKMNGGPIQIDEEESAITLHVKGRLTRESVRMIMLLLAPIYLILCGVALVCIERPTERWGILLLATVVCGWFMGILRPRAETIILNHHGLFYVPLSARLRPFTFKTHAFTPLSNIEGFMTHKSSGHKVGKDVFFQTGLFSRWRPYLFVQFKNSMHDLSPGPTPRGLLSKRYRFLYDANTILAVQAPADQTQGLCDALNQKLKVLRKDKEKNMGS